jgi:putative MATE family efflux protein
MSQWITSLMLTVMQGIGLGGTIKVAFYTGSTDEKSRVAAADTTFWMGIIGAILMTAVGLIFTRPLAFAMGAGEILYKEVNSYMFIISLFFMGKGIIQSVSGIFQGFGDTKTPFRVIVAVNIVHIFIAYAFAFGVWGFPRLEIKGVALATGISETMGAIFLTFLAYKKNLLSFKFHSLAHLKDIVKLGLPVFGERALTTTMQMIYTSMVLTTSISAYAAHSVGMVIESVSWLPGFGFAQSVTTLVGQNLGAKMPHRAKKFSNQALLIVVVIMGLVGTTFWFFPELWMRMFSNDPEVIKYGILYCKIIAFSQIPTSLTMMLAGSLRGAGQTSWVMYSTLIGGWVVRLPMAYILGRYMNLGIFYIWLAMPIDWGVRTIALYIKYTSSKWHEKRLPPTSN